MPTYEYACRKCGEHLEVVQSFKDEPLAVCPKCKGRLRKVFGNIGISFKGSGFYRTDSRPAPSKKSSETKTADTKTTDAKPAETKSTSDGGSSSSPSATPKAASAS